ncbi:hypothetical protein EHP00_2355 [Ecytonucleospora hepatopenaei]|uniref:Uncharacterized protein n=1 Tax=Ecytonucleospora hepatopenaei TaxID=646526 RepID=A0A1W0E7P8_9MICR|nr:hypothetical protein EHP00_2355 [Ecytonucleospora hepatopenaei]
MSFVFETSSVVDNESVSIIEEIKKLKKTEIKTLILPPEEVQEIINNKIKELLNKDEFN